MNNNKDMLRIYEELARLYMEQQQEDTERKLETGELERAQLEHSDITLAAHPADKCRGEHCTLHNRSNHSMRSFPQHWRSDRGIMERICPHSIGHPDPNSPWDKDSAEWSHGCCGCCMPGRKLETEEK